MVLLIVWLFFFVFNEFILFYLYGRTWMESDNFKEALSTVTSAYAPYVGATITFYFTTQPRSKDKVPSRQRAAFPLALFSALFWNIGVTSFLAPLLFGHGAIENSLRDTSDFTSIVSWIVSPAMGFYFAARSEG